VRDPVWLQRGPPSSLAARATTSSMVEHGSSRARGLEHQGASQRQPLPLLWLGASCDGGGGSAPQSRESRPSQTRGLWVVTSTRSSLVARADLPAAGEREVLGGGCTLLLHGRRQAPQWPNGGPPLSTPPGWSSSTGGQPRAATPCAAAKGASGEH
jgi:hypothetical protein